MLESNRRWHRTEKVTLWNLIDPILGLQIQNAYELFQDRLIRPMIREVLETLRKITAAVLAIFIFSLAFSIINLNGSIAATDNSTKLCIFNSTPNVLARQQYLQMHLCSITRF